ncbi:DUF4164 family protein [Oleisolibacter albus]|uniref:DUF4164 family protein n=1 Tax=Oleisolibacter albus TaxID=2171757 RepID=UPI000DF192E7|nr:DUF4164 family protein [Oleisolibacter albus]
MDRLQSSLDRLDEAIGRLDQAIRLRLERATEAGTEAARASFDEEKRRLERELAEARDGERKAREAADAVAARLDRAIERLRSVLED